MGINESNSGALNPSGLERAATDFGLIWEDQPEAMEQKLVDEIPVFVADKKQNVKSDDSNEVQHVLIEGDNLHALHTLQATHRGKVDVIYIDPPYNTGKEFVYNDKLIDYEDSYRHSAWLSFMHKRLKLAKNLLAPSGIILVSIDGNEHSRLRLLLEQLFGERNCIGDLTIVNYLAGRSDSSHFAIAHEYLLVFANDSRLAQIRGFSLTDEQLNEYKHEDKLGKFKPETLRKRGSNARRQDAPSLFYPIFWNRETDTLSLERHNPNELEIIPTFSDGSDGTWRWGKDRFTQLKDSELVVIETRGLPVIYVKQRLTVAGGEERLSKPKSVWIDPKYNSGAGTRLIKKLVKAEFTNPKPLEYILDVLGMCTKNDVVLDFFAGSGTTLHAVAQLNAEDGGNRRCILVTNNENNICVNVTQPRVKAVLTGDWADGKHDALPGALQFYRTSFIERKKNLDRMRSDLARHTVDLITIKEGVSPLAKVSDGLNILQGMDSTVVVITATEPNHEQAFKEAAKRTREGDVLRSYVFTWSDSGVEEEIKQLWPGWEVEPLPADMLSALRRLQPQKEDDLFADLQEGH
jgi:adenine-specific DNA-methyltransferase